MMSAQAIAQDYRDYICRRCINEEYAVHLIPKDCKYGYAAQCPCCRQHRNIVVGFKISGRAKMLFKM